MKAGYSCHFQAWRSKDQWDTTETRVTRLESQCTLFLTWREGKQLLRNAAPDRQSCSIREWHRNSETTFQRETSLQVRKKKKRNNLLFILLAVGPPQPLDCLHSIYVKANKILPRDKKRSVWGTVSWEDYPIPLINFTVLSSLSRGRFVNESRLIRKLCSSFI